MDSVSVKVHAKINLSLNVCGKTDNYHVLDTVMTSVDIADVVSVRKSRDSSFRVSFDVEGPEFSNAFKAARLMSVRFGCGGADICIRRGIPAGGGLGGSSADAAGVMRALNLLYGLGIDDDSLAEAAVEIGSDVPYMLTGGYARLIGTGGVFESFDGPDGQIIIAGSGTVSTKECFETFDRFDFGGIAADNGALVERLVGGGLLSAGRFTGNALFGAASLLNPSVAEIYGIMRAHGLDACMTGSGACVFGIGDDKELRAAETALNEHGYRSDIINIVKKGCEIV